MHFKIARIMCKIFGHKPGKWEPDEHFTGVEWTSCKRCGNLDSRIIVPERRRGMRGMPERQMPTALAASIEAESMRVIKAASVNYQGGK